MLATVQRLIELVAEPRRRRIMDLLLESERTVGELVDELGLSQPAVSKHLRLMREAGLVESRVDGQHRRYRLRPGALHELDTWLEPYRRAWIRRLDDLERHLDHHLEDQ